jgi:hypothetical protein
MKVSFSCTNPSVNGEGEVSFQGDSSYRMKMKVTSEQSSGMPGKMNVDTSAKWLGADCGNVRPLQVSKAK